MSSNNTRIFVNDLLPKIKEDELGNLFSKCGKIENITLKNRYAFIEYSTIQSTQNAIRNFNGYFFHGYKIYVELAIPRSESERCFKCGEFGHSARVCEEKGKFVYDSNFSKNILIKEYDKCSSVLLRRKRFKKIRKNPKRSFSIESSFEDAEFKEKIMD